MKNRKSLILYAVYLAIVIALFMAEPSISAYIEKFFNPLIRLTAYSLVVVLCTLVLMMRLRSVDGFEKKQGVLVNAVCALISLTLQIWLLSHSGDLTIFLLMTALLTENVYEIVLLAGNGKKA